MFDFRVNGKPEFKYRKPEFPAVAEGGLSPWRLHVFQYFGSLEMTPSKSAKPAKSFLQETVEQIAVLQRSRRPRQMEPRPFPLSDVICVRELPEVEPTTFDGADVLANFPEAAPSAVTSDGEAVTAA